MGFKPSTSTDQVGANALSMGIKLAAIGRRVVALTKYIMANFIKINEMARYKYIYIYISLLCRILQVDPIWWKFWNQKFEAKTRTNVNSEYMILFSRFKLTTYKIRFYDYICTAVFLQLGKIEASAEYVSQNRALSSQIVHAQVCAENTSLELLVLVEVPLRCRGRGNGVLRRPQSP